MKWFLLLLLLLPLAFAEVSEYWETSQTDSGSVKYTYFGGQKYFNRSGTWELIDTDWYDCGDFVCSNSYNYVTRTSENGEIVSWIPGQPGNLTLLLDNIPGLNIRWDRPIIDGNSITYVLRRDRFELVYYYYPEKLVEKLRILQPLGTGSGLVNFSFNVRGEAPFIIQEPFFIDDDGYELPLKYYFVDDMLYVEANMTWLNSPERAYPVLLDPTLQITDYRYDGHCYLASGSYTCEKNPGNFVRVGDRMNLFLPDRRYRATVGWDNEPIPDGATIEEINLTINVTTVGTSVSCNNQVLRFHNQSNNWTDIGDNVGLYRNFSSGLTEYGILTIVLDVNTKTLGSNANNDLQNRLSSGEDWFSVGMATNSEILGCSAGTSVETRFGAGASSSPWNVSIIYIGDTCTPPGSGRWNIEHNCSLNGQTVTGLDLVNVSLGGSLLVANDSVIEADWFRFYAPGAGQKRWQLEGGSQWQIT